MISKFKLIRMELVCIALAFTDAQASSVVYFSPRGGCEEEIVKALDVATSRIDVAVYSINNRKILDALIRAKSRNVKIRILTDHTQAGVNAKATIGLVDKNFDVRLHSSGKIMHDKFAVFDSQRIVTGSFNWTDTAERANEENCIFVDDKESVDRFQKYFSNHLWMVNTSEKSKNHLIRLRKKFQSNSRANREVKEAN